jgi:hypothetical protein
LCPKTQSERSSGSKRTPRPVLCPGAEVDISPATLKKGREGRTDRTILWFERRFLCPTWGLPGLPSRDQRRQNARDHLQSVCVSRAGAEAVGCQGSGPQHSESPQPR